MFAALACRQAVVHPLTTVPFHPGTGTVDKAWTTPPTAVPPTKAGTVAGDWDASATVLPRDSTRNGAPRYAVGQPDTRPIERGDVRRVGLLAESVHRGRYSSSLKLDTWGPPIRICAWG